MEYELIFVSTFNTILIMKTNDMKIKQIFQKQSQTVLFCIGIMVPLFCTTSCIYIQKRYSCNNRC